MFTPVKKKSFLSTLSTKTLRKRKKDFPVRETDMLLRSMMLAHEEEERLRKSRVSSSLSSLSSSRLLALETKMNE